jgi:hypothetical protein
MFQFFTATSDNIEENKTSQQLPVIIPLSISVLRIRVRLSKVCNIPVIATLQGDL